MKTRFQRTEEHVAEHSGLRNMTLETNPKLIRHKEARKQTSI